MAVDVLAFPIVAPQSFCAALAALVHDVHRSLGRRAFVADELVGIVVVLACRAEPVAGPPLGHVNKCTSLSCTIRKKLQLCVFYDLQGNFVVKRCDIF